MRLEKKRRTYLILGIDSREGTLKLSNLLSTAPSQQIIITILYKRRIIISSSKLACVVSQ